MRKLKSPEVKSHIYWATKPRFQLRSDDFEAPVTAQSYPLSEELALPPVPSCGPRNSQALLPSAHICSRLLSYYLTTCPQLLHLYLSSCREPWPRGRLGRGWLSKGCHRKVTGAVKNCPLGPQYYHYTAPLPILSTENPVSKTSPQDPW